MKHEAEKQASLGQRQVEMQTQMQAQTDNLEFALAQLDEFKQRAHEGARLIDAQAARFAREKEAHTREQRDEVQKVQQEMMLVLSWRQQEEGDLVRALRDQVEKLLGEKAQLEKLAHQLQHEINQTRSSCAQLATELQHSTRREVERQEELVVAETSHREKQHELVLHHEEDKRKTLNFLEESLKDLKVERDAALLQVDLLRSNTLTPAARDEKATQIAAHGQRALNEVETLRKQVVALQQENDFMHSQLNDQKKTSFRQDLSLQQAAWKEKHGAIDGFLQQLQLETRDRFSKSFQRSATATGNGMGTASQSRPLSLSTPPTATTARPVAPLNATPTTKNAAASTHTRQLH